VAQGMRQEHLGPRHLVVNAEVLAEGDAVGQEEVERGAVADGTGSDSFLMVPVRRVTR
jgi:hypothetical protein